MIAALFVERGGAYSGLPHVDVWDRERDARGYAGPWPVVAHPPCERWSILAHALERRGLRVGHDDGCFASALSSVRRYGGVLEHPAYSYAWRVFGIGEPVPGSWTRLLDGSYTALVYQRNYGHAALKATWLYYVGECAPETLEFGAPPAATALVKNMRGYERSRTPLAFRDKLLDLAAKCRRLPEP